MQPPSYQTTEDDESVVSDVQSESQPQVYQSAQDPEAPIPAPAIRTAQAVRRRPIARYIGISMIAVVLIILVGVALFSIQKAQRSAARTVDLYPGATITTQKSTANSDEIIFAVKDTPDKVSDYYARMLGTSEDEGCKRIFTVYLNGANPGSDPIPSMKLGDSYYKCAWDTSFLDQTQTVLINIKYRNDVNQTQVEIRRSWGNSSGK